MTWGLTAVAGATLVSGYMGSKAASNAANAQAAATQEGLAAQERMLERQIQLQEPWRKAGEQALNKLIPLSDYQKFDMSRFQADPGYAFRLSEGQKALERSAAARGGLISGAALKAATRYGQDMGSQEFTNAFNRYQTERAAQLQPLQALAGIGQTSANTLTNAASQYGAAANEAIQSGANARASGYVGQANALNQAVGSLGNLYTQNQWMNRLTPSYGYTQPNYGWSGTSLNQTFGGTGGIAD